MSEMNDSTAVRFVDVGPVDALAAGRMACLPAGSETVLLCNVNGRFHAVAPMCSHEDYPLCTGALQGETVKCALHGSRFNLISGQPMDEPADEPIRVYPVRVEHGRVLVGLG